MVSSFNGEKQKVLYSTSAILPLESLYYSTIKLKERNGSNIEEEGTDSQMDTWMLFEAVREMPQPESLLH